MPRQDPWPTFVSSQNGRAALSLPLHALPAALSLVVLSWHRSLRADGDLTPADVAICQ
jgi:hypothetical protein